MNLEELCARNLMATKIVTAEREESLRVAVRRMTDHGIHSVVILPTDPHEGYSILTGKDCIEVLCDAGEHGLDELCVEDAMTRPAMTVPAGLCALDCIRLMRHAGVRTAPVIEHDELVGILSFTDVLTGCC